MRAERHLDHGGDHVRRHRDAGGSNLVGAHELVDGGDDGPRRVREPLVEDVGLVEMQVARRVAERRVQQRDVRGERRDGSELLPRERAGDRPPLRVQGQQVAAQQAAHREERDAHLRGTQLGEHHDARALAHLDRAALGTATERGREAEVLLEADVGLLADAHGTRSDEQVDVDAVRRPDHAKSRAPLADQLAHERHGEPGAQPAAERDGVAVRHTARGVGERRALVGIEGEAAHVTARSCRRRPRRPTRS